MPSQSFGAFDCTHVYTQSNRIWEEATIESTPNVKRAISTRFTIVARLMRNTFDRKVAILNVTRSQWTMIAAVANHQGATQRVLSEILEISEASAGRLIDRLCIDGLLERRSCDGDRRARAVFTTPAAEPLLEKLGDIARDMEQKLFRSFSEEELAQLLTFLQRMHTAAAK